VDVGFAKGLVTGTGGERYHRAGAVRTHFEFDLYRSGRVGPSTRGSDRSGTTSTANLDLRQAGRASPVRCWSHSGGSMSHTTITVIREEHSALSAMLRSILLLLRQHRDRSTVPDFTALRAMLFYVDEFPEKRHHRMESELLFPKLRARTPLARELLDRLDDDHSRGERRVRELEHALLAFEMLGESRRRAFEEAAEQYVTFYLTHMALEEHDILPLAERSLTVEDWTELDAAFAANRDPLAGHEPEPDYRALFTRIVNAVPAPIGFGSAAAALHY
jgi:hemerythrin-like domain-containing protein